MSLRSRLLIDRLKAVIYIIFNVTQFASAIIGILVTSIGLAIISWLLKLQAYVIPISTFSAGVLLTLVVTLLIYTRSSRSRWLLQGYRWVSAEYFYSIHEDDPKHHTQIVTILLEAIRPGVDHFENRYLWSSPGKEDPPIILTPGQTLMGGIIKSSTWKYYYIHFGYELDIGERVEVKVRQDLYDLDGKFEAFLAKTVLEPIDKIILHVALPKNNLPTQVTCREESSAVPNNRLIKNTPGKIDTRTGEIVWEIQSPAFGHRYAMNWR